MSMTERIVSNMKKKRIILLACIAGGVVVLGVLIALFLTPITAFLHQGTGEAFRNVGSCSGTTVTATDAPIGGFITPLPSEQQAEAPTPNTGTQTETTEAPTPTPSPTVDPYEELYSKADTSMMKDIVNILLVGVDYATERETWSGKKEWHSDVMIVLAINFEENRADLISLPRDTYADVPGIKGIYKLNASINCGGGLYNKDGSFNPMSLNKVCESAEWMLGGIPVDYYFAVTMTSLKDLVDLCGGLDYDMDIKFHIQGRSYEKGMQHLNGQGFLDYCRVRKGANGLSASETGDDKRVNRQKKILVALFRQMQADRLITQIPDLIQTFDGDLFTNCSYAQTAALAAFAYNLDPENIGMCSMGGSSSSLFQWNFVFTDQDNRVKIIKNVYNVDAAKYHKYTLSYGRYTWCEMLYEHYMELINPLTKYVQKLIDEDDKLPEFTSSPTPSETPPPTPDPTEPEPTQTPTPDPDVNAGAVRRSDSVYGANATPELIRQYTKEQRELFDQYKACLEELEKQRTEASKQAKKARKGKSNTLNSVGQNYLSLLAEIQELAIKLAKEFAYTKVKNFDMAFAPTETTWSKSPWAVNYGTDEDFNEIIVDFN